MLLISCYLSWNSPSLHIAGTGRPALIDILFQFSTLLRGRGGEEGGGEGGQCVKIQKMVVDVFDEAYGTQTGMSADCNVTQLKIMSLQYNRIVEARHEQHCNEVCVSRICIRSLNFALS